MFEGGRGNNGDVARSVGDGALSDGGAPNTAERAGRDLSRDWVGMVRRSAAGFDDGVEGRVGGTLKSIILLVEFLWVLARDAAVGSSYREAFDPPTVEADPEPDAWE